MTRVLKALLLIGIISGMLYVVVTISEDPRELAGSAIGSQAQPDSIDCEFDYNQGKEIGAKLYELAIRQYAQTNGTEIDWGLLEAEYKYLRMKYGE
jgi:hypothetical protein